MAFPAGAQHWPFPVAVFELENSRNDNRIAYSLWKVLCVRAELRIVFCYRRSPAQGASLVRFLQDDVVKAMPLADRIAWTEKRWSPSAVGMSRSCFPTDSSAGGGWM